ncbi:hypothetical protein GCM10011499_10610 [Pelagibacterium lentulum]|uniref:Transposase n=1 Tax=Pelagibacterium lentulum TaxID=2029865 RepID=A0A916R7D4_9HYPH|nr:hypothetical protein GCM10011499_10610 [Pelagibacterium lentulum]
MQARGRAMSRLLIVFSIRRVDVKPFVRRQKNDAADAEAIAEAANRPTMRYVEPKSEQQQARAMEFRTRDGLTPKKWRDFLIA